MYLHDIKLNNVFIDFTERDLGYLEETQYKLLLRDVICHAEPISVDELLRIRDSVIQNDDDGAAHDDISHHHNHAANNSSSLEDLPSFLDIQRTSHARYVIEYCPPDSDGDSDSVYESRHEMNASSNYCDDAHRSSNSFEQIAVRLGLFANIKAGIPRAAYDGIVTFSIGPNITVFLSQYGSSLCNNDDDDDNHDDNDATTHLIIDNNHDDEL